MARLRDGDGFDGNQHNADRRRPSRPAANTPRPDAAKPGRVKQPTAARSSAAQRPAPQRSAAQRPTSRRSTTQSTKVALSLPPMESAPELWLRNIRLSGFAFSVLALVVVAVIVLAPGLRILVEQQQQIAALTAEVNAGTTAVRTYQDDVARWSDPAYIEAQAREKLYYIFPGDRTYLVVDDGETVETSDGQPISDSIQSLQVDWVQSLVASVYTAGLTDATGAELVSPSPVSPTNTPPTTDGN